MSKVATAMEDNDDEIIARALINIREAVLTQNWQIVCDAYNSITNEDLKIPEKKKGRRETIQGLMAGIQQHKAKEVEKDMPVISLEVESMTIPEIKEQLLSLGFNDNDFKNKNKSDLLGMLNNNKTDINQYQDGGTRFGKGKIQIISDPYNDELAKENQKIADKTIKVPVQRSGPVKDNSKDEKADVRFYDQSSISPPPWR